jgi:hypothetical protein
MPESVRNAPQVRARDLDVLADRLESAANSRLGRERGDLKRDEPLLHPVIDEHRPISGLGAGASSTAPIRSQSRH